MYDVVALGELLIDFAPKSVNEAGYPTIAANPGGAPPNFLAALNAYGGSCALIAKVGDDLFGRLLYRTIREAGIGTEGIVIAPDVFTTLAFVSLDADGNRDFSFARKPGADTCLTPAEVDEALFAGARVFHFGTLSLTDEPAQSATHRALELARAHGCLVSLDPNYRAPLWRSEAEAKAKIEWALRQADIVKISDEEIAFLWGLSPEDGARKLLDEYGVSLVYATLGPKGALAMTRRACAAAPCPDGIRVLDTTGAGDIFGGAAMSRFLRCGKAPEDLTAAELEGIARFACTAASLSTQAYGGISSVPDLAEVERKLAE